MKKYIPIKPKLIPPDEGDSPWTLAEGWTFYYGVFVFYIEAGFETDGASIPRLLWRVWGTPLQAPRIYAAMVHDAMYRGYIKGVTRNEADIIYRDIQIELGISRWKAYTEYAMLRLFGSPNWKGDK